MIRGAGYAMWSEGRGMPCDQRGGVCHVIRGAGYVMWSEGRGMSCDQRGGVCHVIRGAGYVMWSEGRGMSCDQRGWCYYRGSYGTPAHRSGGQSQLILRGRIHLGEECIGVSNGGV